jgi:hypothetical protein
VFIEMVEDANRRRSVDVPKLRRLCGRLRNCPDVLCSSYADEVADLTREYERRICTVGQAARAVLTALAGRWREPARRRQQRRLAALPPL